ncbi:MAG: hypothetical protein JNK72_00260 [Myxococcales bacterium]|nr:hypothetical protein [Myxococcales bacterium]
MSSKIQRLPCKLSEYDKAQRAKLATQLIAEYRSKEDAQKLAAKEANLELKTLRSTLEEAARASREGIETRDVETREQPVFESWEMETVRLDTMEVIDRRPMTKEEHARYRQGTLIEN